MNKVGENQSNNINQVKKAAPQKLEKTNDTIEMGKKNDHDFNLEISDRSKELAKELKEVENAKKIEKKSMISDRPGIYFISGFDWLGASSVKGNYDGIREMAQNIDDAKHFAWDQKDEILKQIQKTGKTQPIVLVGHSFGGDTAVEIANELNTIENGFRTVDLMVTLDSVGFNNDLIPQNVRKNINYIAQGNIFINDAPNMARNHERTKVENVLREEGHADLDDLFDIQMNIMTEIDNLT